MLIKAIYWGLVALDTLALLLLFVLGLAAAGSAKTSPLSVALYLLVLPGIPLVTSVLLFVRSRSPAVRAVAFLIAAVPPIVAVSMRGFAAMQLRANLDERGTLTYFESGPMRDIAQAIARNDAKIVATLSARVDVNEPGFMGNTLLLSAFRQLRETPDQQDVLKALLAAGADPDTGTDTERPLEVALQLAAKTGPAPVKLLLDAGADPNLRNTFGSPVYFAATGRSSSIEILEMLLAHGADVNAIDRQGQTVLFSAANTRNWKAVLLLLERGADWRLGRSVNGLPFESMIEASAGSAGAESGFAEVLAYLRRH